MDIFVKLLADAIQPPWSYVAGVAVLVILVFPKLADVYREFRDVQAGRRGLELEKLRLEILKLRRELGRTELSREPPEEPKPRLDVLKPPEEPKLRLDVLKLPEETRATRKLQEIPAAVQPPLPGRVSTPPRGRFVEWLKRHPRFGRPFLRLFEALMAYFMVTFVVGTVAMPVMLWSDPEFGRPMLVFMALFYGALGWLSYRAFLKSRHVRKEMSAAGDLVERAA